MDGVMFVSMNEPEFDGMRQKDYSKDWVMHIGQSDL